MALSKLEQARIKQIAIIPSAVLSVIGSAVIVGIIVRDWKKASKQTYYRIMLGLSIFDIIVSAGLALTSVPAPVGSRGAIFARGNQQTCIAQAFFIVWGYGAIYYTSSLAIYFLLIIRFGKSREWIATHVERYLHAVPIVVATLQAFVNLPVQMYNFGSSFCWISPYPKACADNPDIPCERGVNWTFAYLWLVAATEVLVSFCVTTICMIVICWHVWRTEKRVRDRYDFATRASQRLASQSRASLSRASNRRSSVEAQRRKLQRTRQVAARAVQYISALFFTIVWRYIAGIYGRSTDAPYPLALSIVDRVMRPLQGFLNMIIFLCHYKKTDNDASASFRGSLRRLSTRGVSFVKHRGMSFRTSSKVSGGTTGTGNSGRSDSSNGIIPEEAAPPRDNEDPEATTTQEESDGAGNTGACCSNGSIAEESSLSPTDDQDPEESPTGKGIANDV